MAVSKSKALTNRTLLSSSEQVHVSNPYIIIYLTAEYVFMEDNIDVMEIPSIGELSNYSPVAESTEIEVDPYGASTIVHIPDTETSFDISDRNIGPVNLIEEKSTHDVLTETMIEYRGIMYKILEESSEKQNLLLMSSLGYSYRGRRAAKEQLFTPALKIAEDAILESSGPDSVSLPKKALLKRVVNRTRTKLHPDEPRTLDFELNEDFIKAPDLVTYIRVDGERHFLLATEYQLGLLREAKRWHMDGTFKVNHYVVCVTICCTSTSYC
ncbi:hypothetical protein CHS0354_040749 [Potamilus streckersoni]|uniref:Uncharacterized protein n=1 Tax=Potamilus streckersoni TaxID=2493646 RepID=A0AAE0VYL2_9BIVA|nr:hypothetical protein CHS0354_040749 [Potamilus streckersoni]